jgi:lipoprotein NlpD
VEKRVEKVPQRLHNGKITWRWPTGGNIRNRFDPSGGKKGLDIEGKMGQPIYAAAGGKVVYSGDGLIGYGNLIIIKHDSTYLSAYGHNRRLLVKEGSEVKQGQKIAEMGDSGKQGVILHFEIRRDGKPVDPLRYLPKKDS